MYKRQGLLRPLTPRLYSIASSQAEVESEVHVTVGVVRYEIEGHERARRDPARPVSYTHLDVYKRQAMHPFGCIVCLEF